VLVGEIKAVESNATTTRYTLADATGEVCIVWWIDDVKPAAAAIEPGAMVRATAKPSWDAERIVRLTGVAIEPLDDPAETEYHQLTCRHRELVHGLTNR